MQCNSKQRPSRYNMIFRCIFTKVFQTAQCKRYFLNFIQNDKCLPCNNSGVCFNSNILQNPVDIKIFCKRILHMDIMIHIHIRNIFIILFAKFFHNPCFPDLSCTLQNKWLTVFLIFPGNQIFHDCSIQY